MSTESRKNQPTNQQRKFMSTELTTINASAFMPRSFTELEKLATMLATTNMIPTAFKGKPGDCAAAIMMGAELGVSPMQALQGIAVINGRPSIWGDLMIGLVRSHPDCNDIDERVEVVGGVLTASCKVVRNGKAQTRTFSEADAKKAGLWGKAGPWTQYPQRMLQMRARAFALRDVFADALKGIACAEESQDVEQTQVYTTTASATTHALPQQQAEPAEKPVWPEDRFQKSFTSFERAVQSGKKTPDQIIETVSANPEFALSEHQKRAIRALAPIDVQPEAEQGEGEQVAGETDHA